MVQLLTGYGNIYMCNFVPGIIATVTGIYPTNNLFTESSCPRIKFYVNLL